MTLVAATALALAATRHEWAQYFDSFGPGGDAYQDNRAGFLYQVGYLIYSASYFTAAWSLACLMLGLRRPRAAIRSAFRRPGLVACLVASVILGLRTVNVAVVFGMHGSEFAGMTMSESVEWASDVFLRIEEISQVPSEIGGAIAAAWVVQWASGRWRPEPHWVDRLGRVLGVLWIATVPFSACLWNY